MGVPSTTLAKGADTIGGAGKRISNMQLKRRCLTLPPPPGGWGGQRTTCEADHSPKRSTPSFSCVGVFSFCIGKCSSAFAHTVERAFVELSCGIKCHPWIRCLHNVNIPMPTPRGHWILKSWSFIRNRRLFHRSASSTGSPIQLGQWSWEMH